MSTISKLRPGDMLIRFEQTTPAFVPLYSLDRESSIVGELEINDVLLCLGEYVEESYAPYMRTDDDYIPYCVLSHKFGIAIVLRLDVMKV